MKQYVDVICIYTKNGKIKPLYVVWEDGNKYPIDKITQIIPSASRSSGGMGIRYTCCFGKQQRYLYLEEGKWFIEKPDYAIS